MLDNINLKFNNYVLVFDEFVVSLKYSRNDRQIAIRKRLS